MRRMVAIHKLDSDDIDYVDVTDKFKTMESMISDVLAGLKYYPKIAPLVADIKMVTETREFMDLVIMSNSQMTSVADVKKIYINVLNLDMDTFYFRLLHHIYHCIDNNLVETNVPGDSKAYCRTPNEVSANSFALIAMNKLGLLGDMNYDNIKYSKDLIAERTPDMMALFDGIMLA